jgi:lysophospholipase L1-like esterase
MRLHFICLPFRLWVSLVSVSFWAGAGVQAAPEPKPEAARWEAEIAKFALRDALTAPEANAWLFVGSSSIRLWDLEKSFQYRPLINNGFGGSKLSDCVLYFDKLVLPYDPSAIVIYSGDNDIGKGATASEVVKSFEQLAEKIRAFSPTVRVVFLGIKPSIKRWELWPIMREANDWIEEACQTREGFYFADTAALMLSDPAVAPSPSWFQKDGLHLSASGYAAWSALVAEILADAKPK